MMGTKTIVSIYATAHHSSSTPSYDHPQYFHTAIAESKLYGFRDTFTFNIGGY